MSKTTNFCLSCGDKSQDKVCSPCFTALQESKNCIVVDDAGRVIFLPEKSFVSLYGHKIDRCKQVSFDVLDKIHLVVETIKEIRSQE